MAREHEIARTDFDLGQLADELLTRLGEGMSVQAGDGRLKVVDRHGNPIDVDPAVVAEVVAAHVPPAPAPAVTPLDRLINDIEGDGDLRVALLRWARAAQGGPAHDARRPPARS